MKLFSYLSFFKRLQPGYIFKSLPVEVNNLTIDLHLPIDSQYSLPVEVLNLIVKSKSLAVEVNNSTIELHLPVKVKEKLPIIYSK